MSERAARQTGVRRADAREDAIGDWQTSPRSAGTKEPIWASQHDCNAIWRRYVGLPPMLGPVISRIWCVVLVEIDGIRHEALALLLARSCSITG